MKQLGQFSFEKSGLLELDEQNRPAGVGPMAICDYKSKWEQIFKEQVILARSTSRPVRSTPHSTGVDALLWLLLYNLPENDEGAHQFDLSHPDLRLEDVIVAEDSELRGIIGWSVIAAFAMSIGSHSYPD